MISAVFENKGKVSLEEISKPTIQDSGDAIIRVIRACVCGSDLWAYSGLDSKETHSVNSGHEALGIIEEVGSDVTTVKPGDFVIVPFTHGCGHCAACLAGFDGVCQDHEDNFSVGFQSQYIRFAYAQWALVKVPGKPEDYSEGMLKSLLTLSDVMATGYHAARTAHVKPGDKVVVVGDGAVGQCAGYALPERDKHLSDCRRALLSDTAVPSPALRRSPPAAAAVPAWYNRFRLS